MPDEDAVPFRRDRIPLEQATMEEISRNLTVSADQFSPVTPDQRRWIAQKLALAVVLDPANPKADRVLSDYARGAHVAARDSSGEAPDPAAIREVVSWLMNPVNGHDAKILGACLQDILNGAEGMSAQGGQWSGWIPPLSEYQPSSPEPEEPSADHETDEEAREPLLTTARAGVLLWKKVPQNATSGYVIEGASVVMDARLQPGKPGTLEPFEISIEPSDVAARFSSVSSTAVQALQVLHGNLPEGFMITMQCQGLEDDYTLARKQPLGAAVAVLADATLSGNEPDAIILANLTGRGALILPEDFWDMLSSLKKGVGRKLILPAAASEYLPAFLALERPSFFLEYEVLLATTLQEAIALSAKKPTEEIRLISERFNEIKDRAGSQPVGPFVSNPAVRKRLADISQEAPYHASARMLAIQGAGSRPMTLPRTILVAEIRRAIEPAKLALNTQFASPESEELKKIGEGYSLCRERVDRLVRYTAKEDMPLLEKAQEMVTAIRTLDRIAKRNSYSGAYEAHLQLMKSYKDLVQTLDLAR